MRADTQAFDRANKAPSRAPRYVVQIIFSDSSPSFTSHSGLSNVPGTVLAGTIEKISSISQQVWPDEGRSTIGSLSVDLVEQTGATITAELRSQLLATDPNDAESARDKELRVYVGYTDNFNDFIRIATMYVDGVEYQDGNYRVSARDKTRALRTKVLEPKVTVLTSAVAADATTITVDDTSAFSTVPHGTSFQDAPSSTVGYCKIEDTGEIFRWTGKTSTTFTGVTRGVFGTRAQAVAFDPTTSRDGWPKVTEYIYLELPGPMAAIAFMTGVVNHSAGTVQLPAHWHMGIDWAADIDQAAFLNIGADLFEPGNYAKGFPVRFIDTGDVDGKALIEKEICQLLGVFIYSTPTGKLTIRRAARVLPESGFVAKLSAENVIKHGALRHDYSALINNVRVNYNWDGDDFTRSVLVLDDESISAHGISEQRELNFKGLHTARHTERAIKDQLAALRDRYAAPPLRLPVTAAPGLNGIEIGDTVFVQLADVLDYTNNNSILARTFEVQRVATDWLTGAVDLDLFASTVPLNHGGGNDDDGPALSDAFYTSAGTNIATLTGYIAGSPARLSANVTLTGSASDLNASGSIWYHNGDLTIDSGKTLTVVNQAQLRVKGFLQINGKIDAKGRGFAGATDPDSVGGTSTGFSKAGTQGFLGPTRASDGIWTYSYDQYNTDPLINAPGQLLAGLAGGTAAPRLSLQVASGALTGLPVKLQGTSGSTGGQVTEGHATTYGTVKGKGGAGGASGGGLAIVCRGVGFGPSGLIDTSGSDGTASTATGRLVDLQDENGKWIFDLNTYPGGGAGGYPGAVYFILDGDGVPYPTITAATLVAARGATTINGVSAITTEVTTRGDSGAQLTELRWPKDTNAPITGRNDSWQGPPANMWTVAHQVQYLASPPPAEQPAVPAPSTLTVANGVGIVTLRWNWPIGTTVASVEVYAATTNDRAFAEKAGEAAASSFIHHLPSGGARFYWIRSRGRDGRASAWYPSDPNGGAPATAQDSGIELWVTANPNRSWFQDGTTSPAGQWVPGTTTTDIECAVLEFGQVTNTELIRITLNQSTAQLTWAYIRNNPNIITTATATPAGTIDFTFEYAPGGVGTGLKAFDTVSAVASGLPGPPGADGAPGADGPPGWNHATLTAYKRSVSNPSGASPGTPGNVTYDFTDGSWTPGGGWSKSFPGGTDPIWAVSASAVSQSDTDTISTSEWSSPVKISEGGAGSDGLNVATVFLYKRTNDAASTPAGPSSTVTFDFTTGAASGGLNGWTTTVPAFTGANVVLWITTATASATGSTDTIGTGEWATAQVLSIAVAAAARNLSIRVNKSSFSGSTANGSLYLHGYNYDGTAADVDGEINFNGAVVTVPKGAIATSINLDEGWVLFETSGATPFTQNAVSKAYAPARKDRTSGWQYDNNTGAWQAVTLTSTMVVIGSYRRSSGAITGALVIGNGLTPYGIPYEAVWKVYPGDLQTGAINNVAAFASTLQPAQVVAALPTASGWTGSPLQFLTTDRKLYRLDTTTSPWRWTVAVAGADIVANSITAGQIATAAIGTDELAAGAVTAGKLAVLEFGTCLVPDPYVSDRAAWRENLSDYTTLAAYPTRYSTVTAINDPAAHGTTALRATKNGGDPYRGLFSQPIPLDAAKTYRVRATVRKSGGGDTICYLLIAFLDANGTVINNPGPLGSWGVGSYHYWALNGTAPPSGWTTYEQVFGANSATHPFPSNARSMSVGALAVYAGTSADSHDFQDMRIEEQIASALIADGAITTPKLYAGAVTADAIAATTISVDKLQIGGDNFIGDPNFDYSAAPSTTRWALSNGATISNTDGQGSGKCVVLPYHASGATCAQPAGFPVFPGDVLTLSAFVATAGTWSGTAQVLRVNWRDATGASLSTSSVTIGAALTSYTQVTGTVTAPANARTALFYLQGHNSASGVTVYVDSVRAQNQIGASLIVDGAITAAKLETNLVVAGTIRTSNGELSRAEITGTATADQYVIWAGSGPKGDGSGGPGAGAQFWVDRFNGEVGISGKLVASKIRYNGNKALTVYTASDYQCGLALQAPGEGSLNLTGTYSGAFGTILVLPVLYHPDYSGSAPEGRRLQTIGQPILLDAAMFLVSLPSSGGSSQQVLYHWYYRYDGAGSTVFGGEFSRTLLVGESFMDTWQIYYKAKPSGWATSIQVILEAKLSTTPAPNTVVTARTHGRWHLPNLGAFGLSAVQIG